MIHLILIFNGVQLDAVIHLILLAIDISIFGAIAMRIVELRRQAHWVDVADQRREHWYAEHPVYTASTSDGDDGA